MLVWFSWPVTFFGRVLQLLSDNARGVGLVVGALSLITGFLPKIIADGLAWAVTKLVSLAWDELGNVNLAAIDYVAYANAILPISEFVYLMGVYTVAWLTVIAIRWVKSFFPTVSN